MIFNQNILDFISQCEEECKDLFKQIDDNAFLCQGKVLQAFSDHVVSERHLKGTCGYGYDDIGRDTLCRVYAQTFGAESAIVSPNILSGTHALTLALFGVLRPGDLLLSITGKAYDTLEEVINGEGIGSLKDWGIRYKTIDFKDNKIDYEMVKQSILNDNPKAVFITRSKGYSWRNALTISEIEEVISFLKSINKEIIVIVDNCYGEFVSAKEPCEVGADLMVGSLIKNPGGGIAPTGGYIAGVSKWVEQVAFRFTAPSIGMEIGSYSYGYNNFYQGFFLAPHVVANAIKVSALFSAAFQKLGFETLPKIGEMPTDIICSIKLNTERGLIDFCKAIQAVSPIDSHLSPEPWDMPGYNDKIIMAAGTFVSGASIELSADGPVRPPYIAYMQGSLTYEHGKIALAEILKPYIG